MVAKCANPACSTSFRFMGRGKVFAFDARTLARKSYAPADTLTVESANSCVFFWLCEVCCETATLRLDGAGSVAVQELTAAASAG
jgi:hypothetical protein